MNQPVFPRVQKCGICYGRGTVSEPCYECERLNLPCSYYIYKCSDCAGFGYVVPTEWVQT